MEIPSENQSFSEQYQWIIQPLIGAFASIAGGFFAVIIRSRLERKQEVEFIKISFIDELNEICLIISNMTETHRTSKSIQNEYLNSLSENTEVFTINKQKLFFIDKEDLRRDIISFYKKLNENIQDSINKVGTLSQDTQGDQSSAIVQKFETIAASAKTINTKIQAYKYCVFWMF